YSYDQANNLIAIEIENYGTISYSDYLWSKPQRKVFPGGIEEILTYDGLMRVTRSVLQRVGSGIFAEYEYTYDELGNVDTFTMDNKTTTYKYDNLKRLLQAIKSENGNENYTYDPAGNRLTDHNFPSQWEYNSNNQLVSYGNVGFSYDANGSIIEKKVGSNVVFQFIYDIQNNLVEVKDGNNNIVARYYYDPFGRRLKKETGGKVTYYLYSDEGLIGEFDGSGNLRKAYVYEPDSFWTTNPVAMIVDGDCYFYHNSPLGTPIQLFSKDGEIVWSANYESYGKCNINPDSSIENNIRLPGQYYDLETGLHYNLRRYYDPEIGRYITEDPTRLSGGLNLYLYANDNPLRYTDVTGEGVSASLGIDVGLGPAGGGVGLTVVYCCAGNYYNRYWIASAKIGAGYILGTSVGISFTPDSSNQCPPATGCSYYGALSGGIGPLSLGGSYDFSSGSISTGSSIGGLDLGCSVSAGIFYECKTIVKTEFVRCCN
ncbi:MAG: hypothetical protein DRG71_05320, partial [Deltaproteobacteria bacterium]